MKKVILKVNRHIDPNIQVGDMVKVVDGSSFVSSDYTKEKEFYIVNSYYETTGSYTVLKDIPAEVLEIGVTDVAAPGVLNHIYLPDIKIKIGYGIFFTCSRFVSKVLENNES